MGEAFLIKKFKTSVAEESFAAIDVTYPAGSICTCKKGDITLVAKDTTGEWMFTVPESGTWTIEATNGTNIMSENVVISAKGQHESVAITYTLVLFDSGDNSSLTGGWNGWDSATYPSKIFIHAYQYGNGTATKSIFTNNLINMNHYKTLHFSVNGLGATGSNPIYKVGIHSSSSAGNSYVASVDASNSDDIRLDISDYNDSYAVKLFLQVSNWVSNRGSDASYNVTKIWLD